MSSRISGKGEIMKAAKSTIESRLASVKEAEAPGTEKGQTVTIGRGGNVTITGQNPGESAETKTYDCPDQHLEIPSEKAEEILNLLGAFFGEKSGGEDKGEGNCWVVSIEDEDGNVLTVSGEYIPIDENSIPSCSAKLNELGDKIREAVSRPRLWLFNEP